MTGDWRERAACVGHDPELWFPGPGGDSGGRAKRVCAICPVAAECLRFALRGPEHYGIWAGYNTESFGRMKTALALLVNP